MLWSVDSTSDCPIRGKGAGVLIPLVPTARGHPLPDNSSFEYAGRRVSQGTELQGISTMGTFVLLAREPRCRVVK